MLRPVDLDEYRELNLKTWEAMAPGWEGWRSWIWDATKAVGGRLIELVAPESGQTILELAAGPGDTGFAAAGMVGDDGRLISTDFSPKMVEVAKRRGEELGIANAEYRVMDAEDMDLEDDSVDGVVCRWGYMLMADPAKALAETRRVLRPGGRHSFAVWSTPEENPWASIPTRLAIEKGHVPPPEPGAPGMFSMGDSGRLEELVTGAGFDSPKIENVELEWRFKDFDEYWSFLMELAGAVAMLVEKLDEEGQADMRESTRAAVEPFSANGGYSMKGVAPTVLAT
jgi:ubiquinone/menaquinone biosynthesis C-methylase UbiE